MGIFVENKSILGRKKYIEEKKEKIRKDKIEGRGFCVKSRYKFLDSPLDKGKNNFFESFRHVLPENTKSIKEYVENILQNKRGKVIGIEFGGVGANVFKAFSPGFFKQTVGVTLADERKNSNNANQIEKNDYKNKHFVIEKDLFSEKTYTKLKQIGVTKVDFIIERLMGGFEYIPKDPYLLFETIQKWYSMLNKGGVMFIQIPISINYLIPAWEKLLKRNFSDCVEIQTNIAMEQTDNVRRDIKVIRLKKLQGNTQLPALDNEDIRRIYRRSIKLNEHHRLLAEIGNGKVYLFVKKYFIKNRNLGDIYDFINDQEYWEKEIGWGVYIDQAMEDIILSIDYKKNIYDIKELIYASAAVFLNKFYLKYVKNKGLDTDGNVWDAFRVEIDKYLSKIKDEILKEKIVDL